MTRRKRWALIEARRGLSLRRNTNWIAYLQRQPRAFSQILPPQHLFAPSFSDTSLNGPTLLNTASPVTIDVYHLTDEQRRLIDKHTRCPQFHSRGASALIKADLETLGDLPRCRLVMARSACSVVWGCCFAERKMTTDEALDGAGTF